MSEVARAHLHAEPAALGEVANVGPVRIGIVGLGWWACDVHIPNLLQVPGAAIAALCSRSPAGVERARKALKGRAERKPTPEGSNAFGRVTGVPAFSTYGDLLASDAVDAVVLCTPNFTHGPMALQALRAGKHVLIEKPMATDPAECPPIVAEAERRGLIVQVGVELRYSDVAQAMRRLIQQGAIGEPTILRTNVWRQWGLPTGWRADMATSGGLFHELGVHYIDLLNSLAARPPLWVTAAGGSRLGGRDVDYAFATIGYEGGAVGAFGMCLFAAGGDKDITVEVVGPEGRLVGEVGSGTLGLWPKQGEPVNHSPKRATTEILGFPGSLESVASFVECVRTGARPSVDAVEGERLCRACDAARRSAAACGKREEI